MITQSFGTLISLNHFSNLLEHLCVPKVLTYKTTSRGKSFPPGAMPRDLCRPCTSSNTHNSPGNTNIVSEQVGKLGTQEEISYWRLQNTLDANSMSGRH